jgi:hypothetical protein
VHNHRRDPLDDRKADRARPLFPLTLKDVTLRNRIGMPPMTMHASVEGAMNEYHVMYLGGVAETHERCARLALVHELDPRLASFLASGGKLTEAPRNPERPSTEVGSSRATRRSATGLTRAPTPPQRSSHEPGTLSARAGAAGWRDPMP